MSTVIEHLKKKYTMKYSKRKYIMNEIYSQYSGTLKQLSWVLSQTRNLGSSAHSKHVNVYTEFYTIQKSTPLPPQKFLKNYTQYKTNSRCLQHETPNLLSAATRSFVFWGFEV